MAMAKEDLGGLIDIALGLIKDYAMQNALKRVAQAHRAYLMEEVSARRKKVTEIIYAMQVLECEKINLEMEFVKIRHTLTQEGIDSIECVLNSLEEKRQELAKMKNMQDRI